MSDNNEQNIPEVKTKAKQFYKIYQGIKFDKEHKHSHSKQSFFDSCSSLIDMQFGQHIPSEAMHRQEMKERELKLQLEKDLNVVLQRWQEQCEHILKNIIAISNGVLVEKRRIIGDFIIFRDCK